MFDWVDIKQLENWVILFNFNRLLYESKISYRHLKQCIPDLNRKYVLIPADDRNLRCVTFLKRQYFKTYTQTSKDGSQLLTTLYSGPSCSKRR